jgi:hypothetical protein
LLIFEVTDGKFFFSKINNQQSTINNQQSAFINPSRSANRFRDASTSRW